MIAPDLFDLAWAAGILEGEGCIRINSVTARSRGVLHISIANCDREMLEWFEARWGGKVRTRRLPTNRSRQGYDWILSARQASAFLTAVLPQIRTKRVRDKAVLGLRFQAQKRNVGGHATPAYREAQWTFYLAMRALNRRGTGPMKAAVWREPEKVAR